MFVVVNKLFCSGAGKSTLMATLGYRQTGLNDQFLLGSVLICYFKTQVKCMLKEKY